jgi:hypothetical protein
MVSGRFLSQGREWWGIGRFSRRYLGGLATRENTCSSRAGARAWLWQGVDEARGILCGRARLQALPPTGVSQGVSQQILTSQVEERIPEMARQPRIEYPGALYHVMARIDGSALCTMKLIGTA